ncbi:GbsR/MarR family transcriptional regulator [Haloarchaeobius sp. FL176]|uniref:GbsR/MarR family transcriptional regulator n=1 Tax=Haloarchaeobius sp. FL176 TaxID=2967129 RepID=UPI002147BC14|nr:helix-turn-helix domain-containing protein [Haloarchaeobius sp. FL176]
MTTDVERARERVIDALARSADIYGLKQSYGRLYGTLYFAEEPLSLDELAEQSGYAKSTVSTAMSTLRRFHLVRRLSMPGEGKRAFFEAERDLWRVSREFLAQEVSREVNVMVEALGEAEAVLEGADGERAARDLERVRQLKRTYEHADRLVSALSRVPLDRLTDAVERFTPE